MNEQVQHVAQSAVGPSRALTLEEILMAQDLRPIEISDWDKSFPSGPKQENENAYAPA